MATTLITEIPVIVFSSQIGDIELSTDQEKIVITLEDGLKEIYRSKLYAFDGKVTIVNIGEVIEQYMRTQDESFIAFTMYYNKEDGTNIGSFNINTLYCSLILDIEAGIFGSYNFLTTLSAKRVHRDAYDYIWLFHGQERGTVMAHCIYEDENGNIANISVSYQSFIASDIGVSRIVVSQQKIVNQISLAGGKIKRLLSFSLEFLNRHFTYYIVDYTPEVSFVFKNCFNVTEYVSFSAITTTKTKVNRSTAISGGEHLFYDQSVDKSYEVETASLTNDEAHWVEQLINSHSVRFGTSPNADKLPKIIITDSDCEIHDDDEELNKLKFTWQFIEKTPHLTKKFRSDADGIFTDEYNTIFD